jgi:hypothetical protein
MIADRNAGLSDDRVRRPCPTTVSDEACSDVSDESWPRRSRKLPGVSDDGAKSENARNAVFGSGPAAAGSRYAPGVPGQNGGAEEFVWLT